MDRTEKWGSGVDKATFWVVELIKLFFDAASKGAGVSLWGKLKSGIGWIALEYTVRL